MGRLPARTDAVNNDRRGDAWALFTMLFIEVERRGANCFYTIGDIREASTARSLPSRNPHAR